MIIALSQKKMNRKRIGSFILAGLLSLMAGFFLTAYWDGPKALSVVFAVVVGILGFFTAKAVCKNENSNAYKAARLGLQLFLCAIVMWITLLPSFVPSLAKKETMLKVIAVIWIACVMISRIIMGAHFLSDVTMGMVISLTLFYIFYKKNEFSAPTETL